MSQETELEMVERHLRQSEGLVHRQKEIIDRQRRANQPSPLSERLLESLETALALHRSHLDQLRKLSPWLR